MNANELSDYILNFIMDVEGYDEFKHEKASTMLRQQQAQLDVCRESKKEDVAEIYKLQAEIEALKAEIVSIEKNTDYWADKANWIKNNKPVAKVTEHGIYLEYPLGLNLKIGTLFYTHPVKELTEVEIHQAIRRGFARDGFLSDGIFLEIKELLRKASEK